VNKFAKTSIVILAALVLAGCADTDSGATVAPSGATVPTVTQSSSVTKSVGISEEALKAYADAVAAHADPEPMREALKYTEDGSVAFAYLTHLANVVEARLDGGEPSTEQEVTKEGPGTYKSCADSSDESTCATFADFKVNDQGKIVDLTVNGKEIGSRITLGNGDSVTSGGASFTFLSAYKSVQSNALFVTMRIEAGKRPISPNIYSATYRSPDGKQREATSADGPTDIDARSNALVSMIFKGVKTGGKLTLSGCVADCSSEFKAVVKVG